MACGGGGGGGGGKGRLVCAGRRWWAPRKEAGRRESWCVRCVYMWDERAPGGSGAALAESGKGEGEAEAAKSSRKAHQSKWPPNRAHIPASFLKKCYERSDSS